MISPDPPCTYSRLEYSRVIAGLLERQERLEAALRLMCDRLESVCDSIDFMSNENAEALSIARAALGAVHHRCVVCEVYGKEYSVRDKP